MEDVLDVYTRPYDERYPQVCFGETSKQLLADIQEPLPMGSERPQREDYEYKRQGVRNLFLWYEPLKSRLRRATGRSPRPLAPALQNNVHIYVSEQHPYIEFPHQWTSSKGDVTSQSYSASAQPLSCNVDDAIDRFIDY